MKSFLMLKKQTNKRLLKSFFNKNHGGCPNLLKIFLIKLQLLIFSLHFFGSYFSNFSSWIRKRIFHADPDPEGKMNADP